MPPSNIRKDINYPLSFRVPLSQVEEIDEAVLQERRKRRSDLLEAIWQVAWAQYRRSGSFGVLRGQPALFQALQACLRKSCKIEFIPRLKLFWSAPRPRSSKTIARKLTQWAGKFAGEK